MTDLFSSLKLLFILKMSFTSNDSNMPYSTQKLGVAVCGQDICFEVNAKLDQDLLQLVSHSCFLFLSGKVRLHSEIMQTLFQRPLSFPGAGPSLKPTSVLKLLWSWGNQRVQRCFILSASSMSYRLEIWMLVLDSDLIMVHCFIRDIISYLLCISCHSRKRGIKCISLFSYMRSSLSAIESIY